MISDELKAGFKILVAVAETIRELGEVPAGSLYASLMSKMDLIGFDSMIQVLVNQKLVVLDGNMIRWTGPAKGGAA